MAADVSPDGSSTDAATTSDAVAGPEIFVTSDGGADCVGVVCDDKNSCTNDSCASGKCQHAYSGCEDGNPCTDDSCDDSVKACGHKPNTLPCSDGNACTVKDVCDKGACKPGAGDKCDDGDACTDDSCDEAKGCVHAKKSGCVTALPPCDEKSGIKCGKGVCDKANHVCLSCLKSKDCGEAGYVCSQQTCVSAATCQSGADCKATKQVCNKADAVCVDCVTTDDCGTDQKCVESKCIAAPKCKSDKDCDGVCDTKAGVCVGCVATADCKAGMYCAKWGQCVAAACTGQACQGSTLFVCDKGGSGYGAGKPCDDDLQCTVEKCEPANGCVYVSDDSKCTDGNACTDDACEPGKGCVNTKSVTCSGPCNLTDWTPCPKGTACYYKTSTATTNCEPHGNLGLNESCDPALVNPCGTATIGGKLQPLVCDEIDKKCYPTCLCMPSSAAICPAGSNCYCLEVGASKTKLPNNAGICAP